MPPCTILERARSLWNRSAIQYESYGSRFFESIERHNSSGYALALEGVDCLGDPCRRPAARLDAPALLRDQWGHASLRRHCEELAPPRALCADRRLGAGISHVDPAARLSSLPCPVFSALWDRELHRSRVGADRDGTCRLPLPSRFRPPDRSTGTQDWRHARSTVARCALPLYSSVCGQPLDGMSNALCLGACTVVGGPFPGTGRLGICPHVYLCGDICWLAPARWRVGRSRSCACIVPKPAKRRPIHTNLASDENGRGLRISSTCSIRRMDLAQLAGLPRPSTARSTLGH